MIQQINLYQTGLHKSRVPFSARQMAGAVAALFFVLIAAGAVSHWRQTGLAGELSRLQKRHDEALRRIDDYQQKYPPRSPDPELVRQVEAMTQARQASLELLRRINESQLGNRRGLAEHLSGLARQHMPTVWLRRIRISAGGERLLLEGSTTRSADVPH